MLLDVERGRGRSCYVVMHRLMLPWACSKSCFMQLDIRYSELNDSIALLRFIVDLSNTVFQSTGFQDEVVASFCLSDCIDHLGLGFVLVDRLLAVHVSAHL